MLYMTLNRDLTLSQRLVDVSRAESFTEFKQSETPFAIEEEAMLSEAELAEEMDRYIPLANDETYSVSKEENNETKELLEV